MAGTPKYKVHNEAGTYVASCKEPEACAALLGSIYHNGCVKVEGRIVYRDLNGDSAESYDCVAEAIIRGEHFKWGKSMIRSFGREFCERTYPNLSWDMYDN